VEDAFERIAMGQKGAVKDLSLTLTRQLNDLVAQMDTDLVCGRRENGGGVVFGKEGDRNIRPMVTTHPGAVGNALTTEPRAHDPLSPHIPTPTVG